MDSINVKSTRLNAVSDEAWRMVERADKEGENRAKLRALYLAQETALQIVDVITNNKMLIDEAFKNLYKTRFNRKISHYLRYLHLMKIELKLVQRQWR